MRDEVVVWEAPEWGSLYVVCKDCRKRKRAPDGLKPKKLLHALRRHVRDTRPRPRVVLSSCLGLCPKGAAAIALAGPAGPLRVIAVTSEAQLEAALR